MLAEARRRGTQLISCALDVERLLSRISCWKSSFHSLTRSCNRLHEKAGLSHPYTVLVPRSLSNPPGTPLAFSSNPWAVGDAAEWEQNQAGRSSASRSGLRESFARPETAHFTFWVPTQFASRSIDHVLSVIAFHFL